MKNIKEKLLNTLQTLINEGEVIKNTRGVDEYGTDYVNSGYFSAWRGKILTIIDSYKLSCNTIRECIDDHYTCYFDNVSILQQQLIAIIDLINNDLIPIPTKANPTAFDAVAELENVFNKFHKIARQLRTRHDNRPTLEVNDEYDVQDLLHSLLLLHFDDVRPEERTPSYAGGAARADFLLKDHQIVIEVKKTRPSMTAKDLGEELIIDREKYKEHPDCK